MRSNGSSGCKIVECEANVVFISSFDALKANSIEDNLLDFRKDPRNRGKFLKEEEIFQENQEKFSKKTRKMFRGNQEKTNKVRTSSKKTRKNFMKIWKILKQNPRKSQFFLYKLILQV